MDNTRSMNGVNTNNDGGFPEKLDDWRWIDNGLRDAFRGLMSPLDIVDQTAVILTGCVQSLNPLPTPTFVWSPGYVSIGGEICYFPGQTKPAPYTDQAYWKVDFTTDPTGLKNFQDGSSHETYQIRQAKIMFDVSVPSGYTNIDLAKNYYTILKEKLKHPGYSSLGGVTEQEIKYLRDIDGFVHLSGHCTVTVPSMSPYVLFTLPVGYRPDFSKYYSVLLLPYTPSDICLVRIDTDGKVWLINHPHTGVIQVHLEQIVPFRAFY